MADIPGHNGVPLFECYQGSRGTADFIHMLTEAWDREVVTRGHEETSCTYVPHRCVNL